MSPHADPFAANREEYERNTNRNVFVIMRYDTDPLYTALANTIRDTVRSYGLQVHIAREKHFWPEFWRNIEFFMQHSRYGIVVFEGMKQPEFNPNVAVELGYMLGLGKPCLVLKEQSLPTLPTNIVSYPYYVFDIHQRRTISSAIDKWLRQWKHQKSKKTEDIDDKNRRTEKLLQALEQMKTTQSKCVLRQAGSLSSLAISERERELEHGDPTLKDLLLKERRAVEELIERRVVVRCLISPFLQIVSLQLKILKPDYVRSDVLPRLEQLRSVLEKNLDNPNLQIACTPRLPHDNILIDEAGCHVFLGRRRLSEWGFPQTKIYHDPDMVRSEADSFDSAFNDAAAACLGKLEITEEDYGCSELKSKVIEYLDECTAQLIRMTSPPERA